MLVLVEKGISIYFYEELCEPSKKSMETSMKEYEL